MPNPSPAATTTNSAGTVREPILERLDHESLPTTLFLIELRKQGVFVEYTNWEDRGWKNIYHIVTFHPELSESILEHVQKLDTCRKQIWAEALSVHRYHPKNREDSDQDFGHAWRKWMAVIDFTLDLFPIQQHSVDEQELLDVIAAVDDEFRYEEMPVVLATMITARNGQFQGHYGDHEESKKLIAYIAEHIDRVLPLIPDLNVRRNASREMIEHLLKLRSIPLRNGAL